MTSTQKHFLAILTRQLQECDGRIDTLQRSLQRFPGDALFLTLLVRAKAQRTRWQEAFDRLQQAIHNEEDPR